MSGKQSNTQEGILSFEAGEDLTGKEAHLVELRNTSGKAQVFLPDNMADVPAYLLQEEVSAAGKQVAVRPVDSNRNVRVRAKGSITIGQLLVLADPSTAADKGKVRAYPATTGTWYILGIAESAAADGELVLMRPYNSVRIVP